MPLVTLFGSPMLWVPLAVMALFGIMALFTRFRLPAGIITAGLLVVVVLSLVLHLQIFYDLGVVEVQSFGWGTVDVETGGCTARYPINFLGVFDGISLWLTQGEPIKGTCGNHDDMYTLFHTAINK